MSAENRELLQLAAKAACLEGAQYQCGHWLEIRYGMTEAMWSETLDRYWSPLEDDGDALRLAAALKFTVDFESGVVWGAGDLDETRLGHATADEPCVRRAIVRAAAEIGRRMA